MADTPEHRIGVDVPGETWSNANEPWSGSDVAAMIECELSRQRTPPAVLTAVSAAREVYAERRRREELFPPHLLGEPVWDILLDLFIARSECRKTSISNVCIAANVPATTALRRINAMMRAGLVKRGDHERDRRIAYVSLTDRGNDLMFRYFSMAKF